MKKTLLLLTFLLCAVLLCSCQSDTEHFQVATAVTQGAVTVTSAPTAPPVQQASVSYDSGSYDPLSEEGILDDVPTPAPTMNSVYAGASPVVIDPIDKPTPSPVPALTFSNYATYDALNLRLSFQAPAGWTVNDSVEGSYTITNPDPSMDYAAFVTISVVSVASNYNHSQLTSQVKTMLSEVKSSLNCKSWSPSSTADRTLLDATGVYANYTATLSGGQKIAGRVQAACANKKLYLVHVSYPAAYSEVYKTQVYNKLRSTITITH